MESTQHFMTQEINLTTSLVLLRATWTTSQPEPKKKKKKKKNPPEKNSLYFPKWNFLALILKKFFIFSKESFSYIFSNKTLRFLLQARKIKEIHPGKMSYASGNKSP